MKMYLQLKVFLIKMSFQNWLDYQKESKLSPAFLMNNMLALININKT